MNWRQILAWVDQTPKIVETLQDFPKAFAPYQVWMTPAKSYLFIGGDAVLEHKHDTRMRTQFEEWYVISGAEIYEQEHKDFWGPLNDLFKSMHDSYFGGEVGIHHFDFPMKLVCKDWRTRSLVWNDPNATT